MDSIQALLGEVRADGYRGRGAVREMAKRNSRAVTARENAARARDERR